jgi:hypothetical protein
MKTAISASVLLALGCLTAAGCASGMTPEDQAFLEDEQSGEPVSEAADPSTDESVAQTSEALCSCATKLHCSNGQVTVYENSDCCGSNFFFCPGNYPDLTKYTNNLGWFANWNDRISRISTSGNPKVGVYVYQHVNYGGDVKYIGPGKFVDLGPSLWNDKISSLKVVRVR